MVSAWPLNKAKTFVDEEQVFIVQKLPAYTYVGNSWYRMKCRYIYTKIYIYI